MNKYIITEELASSILNYLVKQPWQETDALIRGLQSVQLYTEPSMPPIPPMAPPVEPTKLQTEEVAEPIE